jgi:hypothetical protein
LGNTDWTAFKSNLQENINPNQQIKSPEDLNSAAQYFIILVQKAAWQSTPQTESKPTTTIDVPLHIRQLIAEKRRARRIWQRTRNNSDQHTYNRLCRQLKATIRNAFVPLK